jgi:two-component system CheB/CheR fusion protein
MPYRTLENMIDGVAITFTDITASKTLEGKLRATQAGMEKHIGDQDLKLEQAGEALQAEIQRKAGSK